MSEPECKNCKHYKGNCGHHHVDSLTGHINYEIPAERMYVNKVDPSCYESVYSEGPDYTNEEVNPYKDLYLVIYYPVEDRSSIEVFELGDLGRVPVTSTWGNIEQLRDYLDSYKMAKLKNNKLTENIIAYNNCWWFMTKAENCRDALAIFWDEFLDCKEENKMLKTFEIYFSDLNEDAQKRIMEMVKIDDPKEMNWDIDMCPIAMYDVEVDD